MEMALSRGAAAVVPPGLTSGRTCLMSMAGLMMGPGWGCYSSWNPQAYLNNVHSGIGDGPCPEVLQHVPGLDAPELDVRVLVVPHEGRLPRLHIRPRGALAEVVKHQLHTLKSGCTEFSCNLPIGARSILALSQRKRQALSQRKRQALTL